jgi:hypothetical protein
VSLPSSIFHPRRDLGTAGNASQGVLKNIFLFFKTAIRRAGSAGSTAGRSHVGRGLQFAPDSWFKKNIQPHDFLEKIAFKIKNNHNNCNSNYPVR